MKRFNRVLSILLIFFMSISFLLGIEAYYPSAATADKLGSQTVSEAVYNNNSSISYNIMNIDNKGISELRKRVEIAIEGASIEAIDVHYSMDWVSVGLARTGKSDMIPEDYLESVTEKIKEYAGKEDSGEYVQPTDYERRVLGILAAGGDPKDIDGIDVIERIYNTKYMERQGINAVIFGLIALDSGEYKVPEDAEWNRDKLIDKILEAECSNEEVSYGKKAGWTFSGSIGDPDMTGMAMTALAPYYNKREDVKEAVDRAVEYLFTIQKANGGFASWGSINSESCAQVIMGLCANNINPIGEKFTKANGNLVEALLSFEVPNNKGFAHMEMDGELKLNGMANEQALYALAQYIYYLDGKGSIYWWGNQNDIDKDIIPPEIETDLTNRTVSEPVFTFNVSAKDDRDGIVKPIIKVNNEAIESTDGIYTITLKKGKNTIAIKAVDSSGNEANLRYNINYFDNYSKLGEKIELEKGEIIVFENGIQLDLKNINIPKEATVEVSDNSQVFNNKETSLDIVGPIMLFDFQGISIKEPVDLVMPIKSGTDINKAAIYYYNSEKNTWEYQDTTREYGILKSEINHFSTYGVLSDTKKPKDVECILQNNSFDKIELEFRAKDDSGIKEYRVFRDSFVGDPINITNKNKYVDTDIQPETTYKYRIKAVDMLGNISNFSKFIEVTTPRKGETVIDPTEEKVSIYMRIEGYDDTVVDRTRVTTSVFNLNPYLNEGTGDSVESSDGWDVNRFRHPTHAHAIVQALEDERVKYDFQDYGWGLYIAMIDGDREFDYRSTSGWMYAVNGKLPPIGCQGKDLKEGDDVLWFFGAYGFDTWRAELNASKTKVNTGEDVTITVKGMRTKYDPTSDKIGGNTSRAMKNAIIYVDGKPYKMDGEEVIVDKSGKAKIKFNKPGTYMVSAERFTGEGIRDMVRPIPVKIKVGGEKISTLSEELEEISENIDELMKELKDKISKLSSNSDYNLVIKKAEKIGQYMDEYVDNIENEEAALYILENSKDLIDIIAPMANKIKNDDEKDKLAKIIYSRINSILSVTNKIEDEKKLDSNVINIIDTAGNTIKYFNKNNADNIEKSIVNLAQNVIEKRGTQKVEKHDIKIEKEKAILKLKEDVITKLNKKVAGITEKLKKVLDKNNINNKLNKSLTLDTENINKNEMQFIISPKVIKTINKNDVSNIKLKSHLVLFNITPDVFKDNISDNISLNAKKIIKDNLDEKLKSKVPDNTLIVDLSARIGSEEIQGFKNDMVVKLPYDKKLKQGSVLKVFYLKDNGDVELVGGEYNSVTKTVDFKTNHFSKYFIKEVKLVAFRDLKGYEWAEEAINEMANRGIINGRREGIFDPSVSITRAEFVSLIVRMLGYENEKASVTFDDIDNKSWYYPYVSIAYKNGLINGKSNIIFDPNGNITREEMAVVISNVLTKKGYKNSDLNVLNIFIDKNNISLWAKDGVSICVKNSIINGMSNNTFVPKQNANRAQAAVMLYRVYNLIN